jgi:hypothetical protein
MGGSKRKVSKMEGDTNGFTRMFPLELKLEMEISLSATWLRQLPIGSWWHSIAWLAQEAMPVALRLSITLGAHFGRP